MEYLQLGRSGLYVSKVGFGTWRLQRVKADEIEPLINKALDEGINLIDMARGYADGKAEIIIGKIVKERGERDRIILATKTSAPNPREPDGFLSTRRAIIRNCEESLKRLGVEYIDLYQLHCAERFVPIDEPLSAMTDLVHQGKVRYIGTSNFKGWQIVEACWAAEKHHLCKIVSDQSEYHIFDRRLERENFPAMQSYGIAALIYSPLCRGLLSGKFYGGPQNLPPDPKYDEYRRKPDHIYFSDRIQNALGKLIEMSKKYGYSPAQLSLAFIMKHPVTAIPLIAPSNLEQLQDCLKACEIKVTDEMMADFDDINPPGEVILGQKLNLYNHGPTARWF